MRPGLWQALAVALAGHAAVLGWLYADARDRVPRGGVQPLEFRVAFRPAAAAAGARAAAAPPVSPAPQSASGGPPRVADAAPPPPTAPPAPARTSPPVAAPALAPPELVVPAPAASAVPVEPASATVPQQEPVYLARGELTVPPRPLGPVDVPFPDDVIGLVDLKVKVTLFIDEDGEVRRVRIDTPQVAEPFERAIRASFSAARFAPGRLHDVPVRSQVRLEVSFAAPNAGTRPPRS